MSPHRTALPSLADAQWASPPFGFSYARNDSPRAVVHRVARLRVWQATGRRVFTDWEAGCGAAGTERGRPPSRAWARGGSPAFGLPGVARRGARCRFGCWPPT